VTGLSTVTLGVPTKSAKRTSVAVMRMNVTSAENGSQNMTRNTNFSSARSLH
jgi:hypothetical protein